MDNQYRYNNNNSNNNNGNNNNGNNKRKPSMMHMHDALVMSIQDCEATCEHMTHHLKMMAEDDNFRVTQSILLRDCADICNISARYIVRNSMFSVNIAILCAQICILCGNECAKYDDELSQNCAEVCYNCAEHCREFISKYEL
ncbi:MAG: ferredoxin [Clostridiales bacterium]|jgi:hypothetical protein|nr:ferredoxin [Clostridiales bacterium]